MKFLHFLILLLPVLASCSNTPKHPQAELINKNTPAVVTEQAILQLADSITANLSAFEKQNSLVFYLDDVSFYVEKYSHNGDPVLFRTYTENEGITSRTGEYYFNNDSLVLVRESSRIMKQTGEIVAEKRTYLRNNIAFKMESRAALSSSSLSSKKFQTNKQMDTGKEDFNAIIRTLNDALTGSNKFDLVFENVISSPHEKHIQLRSKIPDGYSADIVVREDDSFIDSLETEPLLFKDTKLDFKWEIKDKEAVYVPVGANVTSANGLKR